MKIGKQRSNYVKTVTLHIRTVAIIQKRSFTAIPPDFLHLCNSASSIPIKYLLPSQCNLRKCRIFNKYDIIILTRQIRKILFTCNNFISKYKALLNPYIDHKKKKKRVMYV